jgi:hypothetical protein
MASTLTITPPRRYSIQCETQSLSRMELSRLGRSVGRIIVKAVCVWTVGWAANCYSDYCEALGRSAVMQKERLMASSSRGHIVLPLVPRQCYLPVGGRELLTRHFNKAYPVFILKVQHLNISVRGKEAYKVLVRRLQCYLCITHKSGNKETLVLNIHFLHSFFLLPEIRYDNRISSYTYPT